MQTTDTALVPKTCSRRQRTSDNWTNFCATHKRHPSLRDVPDPETRLCYLLVYGHRVRSRTAPKTSLPVRVGTVEEALLAVGTGIAALGMPDPRKEVPGSNRNHPLLASCLNALSDEDDPHTRAYPANITIIQNTMHKILDTAHPIHGRFNQHVIDLCIVGFFWLLRPAEYLSTDASGRSQAFRLQDITFMVGDRLFSATDTSLNDFDTESRITRAALTFNDQKNAVRGKQIGHAATNDPQLCPCKALARISVHLRSVQARPDTPLYVYQYPDLMRKHVSPTNINNALRHSANDIQHLTGIDPSLLSARSLRPGGATALLCTGIDTDVIQLLVPRRDSKKWRYLHLGMVLFMISAYLNSQSRRHSS
jgi:hypothetical protein